MTSAETSSPRRPRLLLFAVLAAAVLLAAFGAKARFGRDADEPAPVATVRETTATASVDTSAPARTIEDEAAFVADEIERAEWDATFEVVRVTTVLRRPVVEIDTDIPGEDAAGAEAVVKQLNDFVLALQTPEGVRPSYCIQMFSAEGELLATTMSTDERWLLSTPPAPPDAAALRQWLDAVYRNDVATPEPWVCHVLEVSGPSADPDGYLTIRTDLDPEHEGDLRLAQDIVWAANSSGATFAPGIRIRFADPDFEWTGLLDGRDIFAP